MHILHTQFSKTSTLDMPPKWWCRQVPSLSDLRQILCSNPHFWCKGHFSHGTFQYSCQIKSFGAEIIFINGNVVPAVQKIAKGLITRKNAEKQFTWCMHKTTWSFRRGSLLFTKTIKGIGIKHHRHIYQEKIRYKEFISAINHVGPLYISNLVIVEGVVLGGIWRVAHCENTHYTAALDQSPIPTSFGKDFKSLYVHARHCCWYFGLSTRCLVYPQALWMKWGAHARPIFFPTFSLTHWHPIQRAIQTARKILETSIHLCSRACISSCVFHYNSPCESEINKS